MGGENLAEKSEPMGWGKDLGRGCGRGLWVRGNIPCGKSCAKSCGKMGCGRGSLAEGCYRKWDGERDVGGEMWKGMCGKS